MAVTLAHPTDTEEYHLPHGSKWPIVVGAGFFGLYLGAVFGGPVLLLGLLLFLIGGYGWIHEDSDWYWRKIGTGPRNGWVGTVLFLGTEVMIFGALFATYFVARGKAEVWPPEGVELPIITTGINTLILLASGATMHYAHSAIRKGNRPGFLRGLWLTLILGGVFLGGQVYEYKALIDEGFVFSLDTYAGTFFALTGTHGAHVFAGLIFIFVVLLRGRLGQFDPGHHIAVETSALYWHFVDAVWVVLYAVIYLGIP